MSKKRSGTRPPARLEPAEDYSRVDYAHLMKAKLAKVEALLYGALAITHPATEQPSEIGETDAFTIDCILNSVIDEIGFMQTATQDEKWVIMGRPDLKSGGAA